MDQIKKQFPLKSIHTFGIDVRADEYVKVESIADLKEAILYAKTNTLDYLLLGDGSNLLFTKDFEGLVIHISTKGKSVVRHLPEHIMLRVQAGENWHEFVMWTLENGYSGIENLALIPGTVGAAPIQNIGAYGVEVKDVIECVEVLDVETMQTTRMINTDCKFGYRNSVFKHQKGKYIILAVTFRLNKNENNLNTAYGAIAGQLSEKNIKNPNASDIAQAVIDIRRSKLPDPAIIGNSGSFFKNPIIGKDQFLRLQQQYPEMPFYTLENKEFFKIPAGWLIEKAGFKGKRFGDAGVHDKQALVLVNYGNAKGEEILDLAHNIQKTINNQFGIVLESEVNIY